MNSDEMPSRKCAIHFELEPCEKCDASRVEDITVESAIERDRIQAALYREKREEGPPVINVTISKSPILTSEEVWLRICCEVARAESAHTMSVAIKWADIGLKAFEDRFRGKNEIRTDQRQARFGQDVATTCPQ